MQIIPRSKLDVIKYSNCLQTADNYRIYAECWYLDCLTNQQWDCLVYEDYQAIMPIPYKKYFGIQVVTQPIFVQQLGVFSKNISQPLVDEFLIRFKKKLIRSYSFNEENLQFLKTYQTRTNYILNLNFTYEQLYHSFNNNIKRNIKKFYKQQLQFIISDEINYFPNDKLLENLKISTQFFKLVNELKKRKCIKIYQVKDENKILVIKIFLLSKQRMIYLYGFSSQKAKELGCSAYIFSEVIREFSSQEMILDFEGSEIEGIAKFFKSFNAQKNSYPTIKNFVLL
jgi:hypothetical protein